VTLRRHGGVQGPRPPARLRAGQIMRPRAPQRGSGAGGPRTSAVCDGLGLGWSAAALPERVPTAAQQTHASSQSGQDAIRRISWAGARQRSLGRSLGRPWVRPGWSESRAAWPPGPTRSPEHRVRRCARRRRALAEGCVDRSATHGSAAARYLNGPSASRLRPRCSDSDDGLIGRGALRCFEIVAACPGRLGLAC
jgi:hypothetical protein